ncbi:glycoside hydrolase family 2 protein [Pontiella agarivorans]|uniref:Glycoside hydrolase family 2 TIM barrel-domain containing protein n=1 Tax=Pontiella agarivorans TaxID=3038953 RepID=A0ABU5N0Z0_9BACT|nr:glycoside hydrolase family 2 TIM barrel-domain containing protein [Pontiella agarivorans]MDZ8120016.1 glycoside hydrolase family 2 TIM barrel-domain containing protein [Pontiella agarivorans]
MKNMIFSALFFLVQHSLGISMEMNSEGPSTMVLAASGLAPEIDYQLQGSDSLTASNWMSQGAVVSNAAMHDWLVSSEAPTAFFRLSESTMPPLKNPWANVQVMNDDWLYLERDTETLPADDDSAYEQITLPHSWNAFDSVHSNDYRRASSWYRKNLVVTPDQLSERLYLRFKGAAQRARVYLNGSELSFHNGGYSAFVCELTGQVSAGTNRVDVWVNNETVSDVAPQAKPANKTPDFNSYGGLYRSVQLISAPEISIARNYYGGPGFRLWSESVSEAEADLKVKVCVDNGSASAQSVDVGVKVLDLDGSVVSFGSHTVEVSAGSFTNVLVAMPSLVTPRLWSPERPERYQVAIELKQSGALIDSATTRYGFRSFAITANNGFFLNGEPYKLRGVNRHQDYFEKANALSLEQHWRDLLLIKEAGCNWLRLAHYQQDEYVVQLCDEMGLLVWEEVPYLGGNISAMEPTLRSMMKEMIEQHFNHAAIVIWGMGNEVWANENLRQYLLRMKELVHQEDPLRKAGYVTGDTDNTSDAGIGGAVDVLGYNLYRGWYGNSYTDLTDRLNELHAKDPDTPLILTEFGAGSDLTIRKENPRSKDFSIEYQNDFLESHLQQIQQIDWLCGANWWAFCDFGSVWRGDSMPHINQKGMVTFKRDKKPGFYLMKSYWNDEPVVYIEAAEWTPRDGDSNKVYRVFSNMNEVEFFQNGVSLGTQSNLFSWSVALANGTNTLSAVGRSGSVMRTHTCDILFGEVIPVSGITVTDYEAGNPGPHLVDGDLSTRWAAEGTPTITYDMGEMKQVSGLDIKFYKGDERTYGLDISGSVDGQNWSEYFSGSSSLNSGLVRFDFSGTQSIRFIRIQSHGNSANNWNSYYELIPVEVP